MLTDEQKQAIIDKAEQYRDQMVSEYGADSFLSQDANTYLEQVKEFLKA